MHLTSIKGRDPANGEAIEVFIEEGVIHSIIPTSADGDLWLSPGFIDLQVNGYGGCDLNAASVTPSVVIELTRKLAATGVTTFLPTLITAAEMEIAAGLCAISEARRHCAAVAHAIPCVHLRGRISLPAMVREEPIPGNMYGLRISRSSTVGRQRPAIWSGWSLCLLTGTEPLSTSHNCAGKESWWQLATRMPSLPGYMPPPRPEPRFQRTWETARRTKLARHPNLIWAQLADDRLTATFIADGHHLPADTLKSMLRAKGIERSVLVSDAVALAGLPAGLYDTRVGGRVELAADGRIGIPGTPTLAGAALPLKAGIANVAGTLRLSLRDALLMATENPGRYLGGRGVLKVGAPADLVQFQWVPNAGEIEIRRVFILGVEQ